MGFGGDEGRSVRGSLGEEKEGKERKKTWEYKLAERQLSKKRENLDQTDCKQSVELWE